MLATAVVACDTKKMGPLTIDSITETVSEGEIVDAINRPIVPFSIDAIKRRCNAGMGRCQGGFCGPRVHEILARELGMSPMDILMDESKTFILTGRTKEESKK